MSENYIQKEWVRYAEMRVNGMMSPDTYVLLRHAFFSGAVALSSIADTYLDDDFTDDEAEQFQQRLDDELEAFVDGKFPGDR